MAACRRPQKNEDLPGRRGMKKTMRAAVCKDFETIEIEDVPVPEPGRNEVLVQVRATGLCGSDLHGYEGTHPMIEWPVILGHEASGIIAACGDDVQGCNSGDEVVIEPLFTCGICPACVSGRYHLCPSLKFLGHQVPGTLAEYVVADSFFIHSKPGNVPFEEAALTEPAASPLHAVERCDIRLGDFVVIMGSGVTGSFLVQYSVAKGAEVLVSDPVAFKLELAREFGAHHAINPEKDDLLQTVQRLTGGAGADTVFEAVGLSETLALTTSLVKRGGTILLIGYTGKDIEPFSLSTVTLLELNVLGSLAYCHDFQAVLRLMSQGTVKIKPLITKKLPLEKVEEGILMMKEGKDIMKIVVTYD